MPRYGDKTFHGNKNSGTKTKYEFAAEVLNNELANSIINEELQELKGIPVKKREHFRVKDIAMPIAIKGMVDKKIIEVKDFNSILEKL